jgi:ferredoxin
MRVYVACRNLTKGTEAKEACNASCIGCGICFKTCQHGAIEFINNIAYIDFTKCKLCRECEAMCPRGSIHGVNFPKPLDKEAVKARVLERQKKAREAKAAEAAASKPVEAPAANPAAEKPVEKKEE